MKSVRAFVSVALLVLALSLVDFGGMLTAIQNARSTPFLIAISIQFLILFVLSVRWTFVLASLGADGRLRTNVIATLAGGFFNQILPTSMGGDAIRIFMIRRDGIDVSTAVESVFVERVVGLIALCFLTVAALLFGWTLIGSRIGTGLLILISAGLLSGLAIMSVSLNLRRPAWLARLLSHARSSLAIFWRDRKTATAVSGLAVAGHLLSVLTALVLGDALGLDVPVNAYLILFPPVLLCMMIPLSIGGWGLREGGALVFLPLAGIAPEKAVALSLLFGASQFVAALPGLVLWHIGGFSRKESGQ